MLLLQKLAASQGTAVLLSAEAFSDLHVWGGSSPVVLDLTAVTASEVRMQEDTEVTY